MVLNQMKHYGYLVVGTFIIALCFNLLQSPNQIASGGLTGAALVISSIVEVESLIILWGLTIFVLGVSCFFLGKDVLIKSVIGSVLIPLFVLLTNDIPPLTDVPLLAAIYSGLGVGVGLGIVFSAGGSVGGFTLFAQILFKYKSIKHSSSILYLDAAVMVAAGIVYSPEKALYALIGAFITKKTMDLVLSKNKNTRVVYIITSLVFEEKLQQSVLFCLERGLTKLSGAGGYSQEERVILMTVIPMSKAKELKKMVQHIDPHAFLIFCEATEVVGEGFSEPVQTFPTPPLATERSKLSV